ncbi:MAG: hypothetical protein AB1896_17890 [Thermodesulfobacteriota bacterium]
MPDIKPGIYLEVKKGTIGVGHTAKSAEYRNFWMTLNQGQGEIELLLLNEDFMLTGVRDCVPESEFATTRFTYIPQGDKRYQLLLKKLAQKENQSAAFKPRPAEAGKAKAPPEPSGPTVKWWDSPKKETSTEDIFATRATGEKKVKESEGRGSGNWWDPPDKTAEPSASPKTAPAPKKNESTVRPLKKSWWDT